MSTLVLRNRPLALERVRLRLGLALRRPELDAALAGGVDPTAEPALALRAEQLCERRTRTALANTLRDLLDAAEERPIAWHKGDPRPPLECEAVLAARAEVLALVQRLTGPGEIPVRALALAAQLAWSSASPVYAAGSRRGVADFAETILDL